MELRGARPEEADQKPVRIGGAVTFSVKPIPLFDATAYVVVRCSLGYDLEMLVEEAEQMITVLQAAVSVWRKDATN